jgi:L-fuconolactonase
VIDAHQHFWSPSRGDYRWLGPEHGPIYRDCLPADLEPWLHWAGIHATILVQAADSIAETNYLLSIARETPFVAGVVGWLDLEARTAPAQIERLAADPLVVGVRPMLQDLADPAWMLRPSIRPAIAALIQHDLAFDALVRMDHLPYLRDFLRRYPELRVVVDHAAKPVVACGMRAWLSFGAWRVHMEGIARESRASCKLSGLVTEADGEWTTAELRPYFDALMETFGPRRLLWGSDWPMVELAGGFEPWWRSTVELVSGLAPEEGAAILGENAAAFYRLRAREQRTSHGGTPT